MTSPINTIGPIYSIGYGNRTLDEFIGLLAAYQIVFLIDVRSSPYSRFNPDFSKAALEHHLAEHNIRYVFMGDALGGQPDDQTCFTPDGKVDYEKLAATSAYRAGIERIKTAWQKDVHVVLMCSELKPEQCHRSKLIGKTLQEQDIAVTHIDETGALKTQETVNDELIQSPSGQPPLPGWEDFMYPTTSRKKYSASTDSEDAPYET